jgi:hypothetical protein
MTDHDCNQGDSFDRLERKLDALDEKLDKYHEQVVDNKADIAWIKGSFKWATSVIIAAIGFIISLFFKGN